MVNDAQAHAEDDRKAREYAEAKNQLDSLRLQAKKVVDDAEGATDDQKAPVLKAVEEVEAALGTDTPKERLEELTKELAEKLQAFQQELGAAGAAAGEAGPAAEADEDDVIDADFKPAG